VRSQKQFAALEQGLAALGWAEGRTVHLESRWKVGDPAKALTAASELIAQKPDLLVANATPSLAAMRRTGTALPVVVVSVADPVGQGLVPSIPAATSPASASRKPAWAANGLRFSRRPRRAPPASRSFTISPPRLTR
jgi:putative ABC transport system substrate-binding protein